MKSAQNHEPHRLQYPGRDVSRIEKRALGKLEEALGGEL